MTTTLLVDYGEVISWPQPFETRAELAAMVGLPVSKFEERYWSARPDYDRGLSAAQYWQRVASAAAPLDAQAVAQLVAVDVAGWMHLNPLALQWVRECADRGDEVWLLSNAPNELAAAVERSSLRDCCTGMLFSARLGVAKPDRRCFEHAHNAIGGTAADIMFIDDRAENIHAASTYGMQATLFKGVFPPPGSQLNYTPEDLND